MFLDNTHYEDDAPEDGEDNFGAHMEQGEAPAAEDFFVGDDAVNDDPPPAPAR